MNDFHLDGLAELHSLQDSDGCFPSTVTLPGGPFTDRNGFVTALVVRALRHAPHDAWSGVRERALAFISTCRSSRVPGAFSFWPDATRPSWAPAVPADADDTALMLGELLRHGWLDRQAVLNSAANVLLLHRVGAHQAQTLPPWIAAGSFFTWIAGPDAHPASRAVNVVDCCVNANVAALLARAGALHFPGYDEAVRTVIGGLDWAQDHRLKLSSLIPFYPSLGSLEEALDHAVECGAHELGEALRRLRALPAALLEPGDGVCRGAYGRTIWRSAAVDLARRASGSLRSPVDC